MTGPRSSVWPLALAVAVIVALSLAGRWLRSGGRARCALDGLKINPLYQVRIEDDAGVSRHFCCLRCAERWLALAGARPRAVHVTDEASGDEIDAGSAWFVTSPVTTNPITRNRIHAFRDRADAEGHARDFRGALLAGAKRPLQIRPYPDRN
jgi:hypothetical protein